MVRKTMRKASTQKISRFGNRASATQKRVVAEAARFESSTINDFMVEHSADQVHFKLPQKQWKEFCDLLDAPPKPIPTLCRLLGSRGLFDG